VIYRREPLVAHTYGSRLAEDSIFSNALLRTFLRAVCFSQSWDFLPFSRSEGTPTDHPVFCFSRERARQYDVSGIVRFVKIQEFSQFLSSALSSIRALIETRRRKTSDEEHLRRSESVSVDRYGRRTSEIGLLL